MYLREDKALPKNFRSFRQRRVQPKESVGSHSRAVAANIVNAVALGFSLNEAIPQYCTDLDVRDSAFVREIVYGTLRQRRLLLTTLNPLFDHKLTEKHRIIQALLLTAFYQIVFMQLPAHAVVAATVGACGECGQKSFTSTVNAILRRFLREGGRLVSDCPPAVRFSYPDWLFNLLEEHYGRDQAIKIAAAGNIKAPLFLRLERSRLSMGDYASRLQTAQISAKISPLYPYAIELDKAVNVTVIPGFNQGLCTVQDVSAQLAATYLGLEYADAATALKVEAEVQKRYAQGLKELGLLPSLIPYADEPNLEQAAVPALAPLPEKPKSEAKETHGKATKGKDKVAKAPVRVWGPADKAAAALEKAAAQEAAAVATAVVHGSSAANASAAANPSAADANASAEAALAEVIAPLDYRVTALYEQVLAQVKKELGLTGSNTEDAAALPALRVLDCCCAPGGKSAHILDINPLVKLTAIDVDELRLEQTKSTLERLGRLKVPVANTLAQAQTIEIKSANAQDLSSLDGLFDRILVDAPCSGTGVISRHPDIKWLRRAKDIANLTELQSKILDAAYSKLKPGGILLYTTCSILPEENSLQVQAFRKRHPEAIVAPVKVLGESKEMWQRLPREHHGDGFFYARFIKPQA